MVIFIILIKNILLILNIPIIVTLKKKIKLFYLINYYSEKINKNVSCKYYYFLCISNFYDKISKYIAHIRLNIIRLLNVYAFTVSNTILISKFIC